MKRVFQELNQMVEQGVIDTYAIGGSVGYIVYVEPFHTEDIDVFVMLPQTTFLISLAPIYDYARDHGFDTDAEHILIDGERVQFVVAPTDLEEEAIANAQEHTLFGEPVRVMAPEYLVATSLRAGRHKDFAKVEKMRDEYAALNQALLDGLVDRFGLTDAWARAMHTAEVQRPYAGLVAQKFMQRRKLALKPFSFKVATLQKLRDRLTAFRS